VDILGIRIEDDAARLLAGCSRGTPRIANRLLRRMRDFAQVFSDGVVTKKVVADGLGRLAIDSYGLESHDREILKAIIEKYGGGPVGADTLAISVGESNDTLEDFYEPYLIQRGFLQRTPRGRVATALAYEHLGLAPKNTGNEDQGLLF
jgi:Holliday junction DNA helicase RuvB